jgi:uncharacterized protein (DUF58 family)
MSDIELLDSTTRRKLEQLILIANKVRAGSVKGERRSVKRGTSIEFADYRNYVRGDDLRKLDWKVYARTGKLFIKQYEDEEDLAVHLFMDTSMSMDFPRDTDAPNQHKFIYGQRLLAGLATISLATNDRLVMGAADEHGLTVHFGPNRGRVYSPEMFRFVRELRPQGSVALNAALLDYARRKHPVGLFILISDMFHESGYLDGLDALLGRGYEVVVLHTLAPEEVNPPLAGDLRLIDAETGRGQEVTIDGGMREVYFKRLHEWQHSLETTLRGRGVHYLPIQTDTPFDQVILSEMRRQRLVR